MFMDQTETSIASLTERERELESHLKDLLERVLQHIEKFIETKEELNQVEAELKDYESLCHLVGIIKAVFTNLMTKVEKKIVQVKYYHTNKSKLEKTIDPNQSYRNDDEYEKLEQALIKYENEIRKHISVEQQLKLYAESIQNKLDESEQIRAELLDTTKINMSKLKRENQEFHQREQQLQNEIILLKQSISNLEKESKRKSLDSSKIDYLQSLIKSQVSNQPVIFPQRHQGSYSEHKLSADVSEIALASQQSQKKNYYSIINNQNTHKKSEVLKTIQHKDLDKIYGELMNRKHNSLSSINDIMMNHEKKPMQQSKPNSQNNSVNLKNKGQKYDVYEQSRSRSNKREGVKQRTLESLIKLK